jgi:ABC-type transporter Mla MlaB component
MATKDNPTGLLSKVAKFVRNPMTNWADLDSQPPPPDSGYSKQALKEMIERKRQNDFVRKREFDQLRKLRSRDPAARAESAGRPSFFQTSIPSNIGERAVTLKKIDEIEAQMSKQWWKGKAGEATGPMPDIPITPSMLPENGGDFALTQPGFNAATPNAAMPNGAMPNAAAPPRNAANHGFAPTDVSPRIGATGANGHPSPSDGSGGGFSTSKLFAVELSDDHADPDLEEAAIRFANGDDQGAEAGLLEALQSGDGLPEQTEIWTAALFDLYRATDQQGKFDRIALDFAERFGRSAPAWISMPAEAPGAGQDSAHDSVAGPLADTPVWECPARLDLTAMGTLHLALASAPLPWYLNWGPLKEIEPNALHSLGQLFANWCTQRVRLRFDGVDVLSNTLLGYAPSGNNSINTTWWRIRMDLFRITRKQDEFELLALDYCVTYEVSPPAWQDARCDYVRDKTGRDGVHTMPGALAPTGGSDADSQAYTAPIGLEEAPVVIVELAGEIAGDAAEALLRLEAGRHQASGRLVISCARLIRVDFSAAGSILNWVAGREEEGCNVQFREVHRLVAAFFNVIGINEHARVVLRSN